MVTLNTAGDFMRLVIICDNCIENQKIITSLVEQGNIVDAFDDINDGFCALSTTYYCAAILLNPNKTILKSLSDIQLNTNVALIVLHANSSFQDRIEIYNTGIDDCMEHNVDIIELQVRIKAAVRRRNSISDFTLRYRDITFNLLSREVCHYDKVICLTAKEKCLLEAFFLSKGRILSKRYLEDKLFPWNQDINSNVIHVYISSLRKKLGQDYIITHYGQGYRLG